VYYDSSCTGINTSAERKEATCLLGSSYIIPQIASWAICNLLLRDVVYDISWRRGLEEKVNIIAFAREGH
jgi:hypothetical protein